MQNLATSAAVVATCLVFSGLPAQEAEEKEPPSLGDLFNKVKDIKVPDSVSNLPNQITELKEAYLETAKTVEELQKEVEQLRSEVYALRKDNEAMRQAVSTKVEKQKLSDLMKPTEISATQLVTAYETDLAEADAAYRGKYLKVVGYIDRFEAGTQAIEIFLKSDSSDRKVRCIIPTGNNLYVDILPAQGRLVSRNDRRALLSTGQPVTILGSCIGGIGLNVEMEHCTIEGLVEPKKEE
ncbi:MAG: hypothetical protein AAGF67_06805 [Verrucomicrobiota bacterium]